MIVDTAGLFPEGKGFVMECSEIPADHLTRGTLFWDFSFTTHLDGAPSIYRESIPIWLAGPIFKALGFKEVGPGRFEVEPTQAVGRKFKCDIIHEVIKDKPYARMKNMVLIAEDDQIPF